MTDRFSEHQTSPSTPVWVSLNRALASVIILLVLATLAIRYLPETSRCNEMQAQVQDLENKVSNARAVLQFHERDERLLRSNSEYLSMIARDKLDLMQEGEVLYRFDSTKR